MVKQNRIVRSPYAWLMDQHRYVRIAVALLFPAAEPIQEIFASIRRHSLPWLEVPPEFEKWRAYFRNHRLWEEEISRLFDPVGHEEPSLATEFRKAKHKLRHLDQAAAELGPLTLEQAKRHLEAYELAASAIDDAVMEEFDADLNGRAPIDPLAEPLCRTPAFQYLIRVFLPCLVIYRKFPGHLLRLARLGDRTALSALLTVDKTIIFEPKITRLAYRMAQNDPKAYHHVVAHPLYKSIPNIGLKKIRIVLLALISLLAEPLGGVNAPALKEFADSVFRHQTGKLYDPDIPAGIDALPKFIQREKVGWRESLALESPGQK
jgi:hypothetical protein